MTKLFFYVLMSLAMPAMAQKTTADALIDLETSRLQIETQKILTYSNINKIQNNIESLVGGLNQRKKKLALRLQSAQLLKNYKWGTLLGLKNITLLQRNLQTVRIINQHDLNFIHEQIYKLDELKKEKENLIAANAEFDHLSKKLSQQELLISKEENLENEELVKNSRSSLLLLKGQLVRPVSSEVKEGYGMTKYNNKLSDQQYMMFNKGYTFKASLEPVIVQAVGPGKVIFRDVLNHWGESIILEHDGGYYSVYANVKNCLVALDQKVQMSEKLCETSAADFYFELRHYKITINPIKWIKDLS